jgi:uncharacterized protein YjbI with pentapeptide repeats
MKIEADDSDHGRKPAAQRRFGLSHIHVFFVADWRLIMARHAPVNDNPGRSVSVENARSVIESFRDGDGKVLFENPVPNTKRLPEHHIYDVDGNVLYAGRVENAKKLVQLVVGNGYPLTRADLRRLDLTGLGLDGGIFDEANLDGADLRGLSAKCASFVNASMRGIRGQGLIAERAVFNGADLGPDPDVKNRFDVENKNSKCVPTHLEGARLTYAKFDGAVLDRVVFDGANMGRAVLARVKARRTSFRDTTMRDVDFSFGIFIDPDFRGARMETSTKLERLHLPDRTVGAASVNGKFKGAHLDETLSAFRRDKLWSTGLRALAYFASSAAIVVAMHHFGVEGRVESVGEHLEILHDFFKDGATAIALTSILTTAGMVLKDQIAETLRDHLTEAVEEIDMRIRHACESAINAGVNLKNLVMAAVRGPGAGAIVAAMQKTRDTAEKRGFFSRFLSAEGPSSTMIFADRRHLALALEALCSAKTRHRLNGDVVLIRNDIDYGEGSPSLIRLRADGITSLAWTSTGKLLGTADYDRAGNRLSTTGDLTADPRISDHMRAFERAVLNEHRVKLFYDNRTNELRAGRDGSILVLNRRSRRPDNAYDAALLTPDGRRRHFREGSESIHGDGPYDRRPADESHCDEPPAGLGMA